MFKIALVCYGLGAFAIIFPKRLQVQAHYFSQVMSIIGSSAIFYLAAVYLAEQETTIVKLADIGSYYFAMDAWSAAFLVITGLAGIITSVYACGYALGYLGKGLRALSGLWCLFLLSMVLVIAAQGAFSFLLAWEVMALVSFLLVNQESEKKETWQAAYQYLVMTHIGTAAIMIAFLLVGYSAGGLTFDEMSKAQMPLFFKNAAFLAAFAGFALKSGLVPLHVWLPNAHPAAPSHVSALMSGVMLKVAVYGFGRFIFQFLGAVELWWGILVLVVGLLSAFLGALYAQMEVDMKRILAYSSVENMGIIFAGVGTGMILLTTAQPKLAVIGFAAALVHAFNHSVMKTLLFMAAGAIMHAVDSKDIEKMGGLGKLMPWTAWCTLVGCAALAALPLTNGFVGEWLTLQGFITLAQSSNGIEFRLLAIIALVFLGLTGALALGCFVRLYGTVFLGRARTNIVEHAHEPARPVLIALTLSAVMIVITGIMAGPVVKVAQNVIASEIIVGSNLLVEEELLCWSGIGQPATYGTAALLVFLILAIALGYIVLKIWGHKFLVVNHDVTWNCGTVPTARQQYSATGFSKPVRRAFDFLLKPRREVRYLRKENKYFGRKLSYNLMLPDRFSEKLYAPAQHFLVKAASFLRRIQTGSVQLYVSYVMAAMLIVLIWGAF